ncbi:SDR family oxidoreductase [Shimazuella alba]|uniref:SDR family NAD(P)-dependent oxidoreductase n=1 Tax=Shimazuella alba TaxID=2690964 RepID=A0A6I4VWP7_9BACL|nr:SDR family oxidoreductase [Shimazuella alba]MXQ52432.1 SDR family NAD(P)-dependent oxidoreductase [Shimazuella alba]
MLHVEGKVIILTGASSGIGEATARLLAQNGAKVILAARREERLLYLQRELQQRGRIVEYKVTNVSSQSEVEDLVMYTIEKFGHVDVLINNAGIMPLSYLHERKVSEWDQMIDVNMKGILYGIDSVLPHMRKQKKGHIINVSSVTGHIVHKTWAVYSGTKFAVRAITEALRQEEVKNNIRTTIICPGGVKTELANTISTESIKKEIDDSMDIALSPNAIANGILYALSQPEEIAVNEIIIRPTRQEL